MTRMRTALYLCPVDGCAWQLDELSLPPTRIAIGPDLDAALTANAKASTQAMEATLREHMETHDVVDFLRTIQRLNQDLAQGHSGIRPHVYRSQPDEEPQS